jgi:RHS repeat-associated protein
MASVEYFDEDYETQNLYYYHPDHLGSTSYVTDYQGMEFEHMEYTPYGESWIDEGSNRHIISHRFTAKELDEETGLYYFGARYLDPQTSRWMSVDPARDGQNWYSYVSNNPLKYTDPTGLKKYLIITTFQGGGAENVGTTFIDAANTRAEDIRNSSQAVVLMKWKCLGMEELTF